MIYNYYIMEYEKEIKVYTFLEALSIINQKYLLFLNDLLDKYKYHEFLRGSLEYDIRDIENNINENNYYIIKMITDNFLFCLEQISDNNDDYFIYQKEKIKKKNGKFYKSKLPKIGSKTLLKKILEESDGKDNDKIFKNIYDIFILLTFKNENDEIYFNQDYINYVKNNFVENKNFSKMIIVFDNTDDILNSKLDICNENVDDLESENENLDDKKNKNNKNKNKKKNNKNSDGLGSEFMKGLENTKIAQLAKNISEKINIEDFPDLSDPSKLLSSLTDSSQEGSAGGIQNLLKFVMGEVEGAFKDNNLNQNDLVNEAQDMMNNFKNMSGFDPMSLLNPDKDNKNNIDINQFANIFSKMSK